MPHVHVVNFFVVRKITTVRWNEKGASGIRRSFADSGVGSRKIKFPYILFWWLMLLVVGSSDAKEGEGHKKA